MREGFEDWDFWMSMFQDGKGTAYKIPQVLFYYRIKPVSRNNTAAKKNIDFQKNRLGEPQRDVF